MSRDHGWKAGSLEIVTDATGTHNRYNLSAYGKAVAIVDLEEPTPGSPTITDQYLLTDNLGSVDVATDSNGAVVNNTGFSFGAFGNRRDAATWQVPASGTAVTADRTTVTHRGFTGHEMLDNLNLVHMNGRVYDPTLGRFLSVDPVFQFPTNTQSLNPYSYVLNNPLSNTDPTGYWEAIPDVQKTQTGITIDGGWGGSISNGGQGRDSQGHSIQAKFDELSRLTGVDFNKISGAFDNGNGTMSVIGGRNGAENSQSISETAAESKQSSSGGTATPSTNSVGSLGDSNKAATGAITVIGTDASQTTGGIHTDKVDLNMEMSFRNADDGYASANDAAIAQYKAYNAEYLQAMKDGEELTGLIVSINGRFFFSNMAEVHAQFTATENLQGMLGDLAGFTHTHPDGTIFNGLDYVTPAGRGLPYYERNSVGNVYRWDSSGAARYQNYIRQMEQSGSAMAHETEIANPGRWGISNICPGGDPCVN